jgi:hypothetical protein
MPTVLPTAKGLAATYDNGYYDDAWEAVEQYRRVQQAAAENPNRGSQALATKLELPRSRIRTWTDGAVPDPVRAIQTALDHGWLEPEPHSALARHLAGLAGHVLGGGSLSTGDTPRLSVTPGRRVSVSDLGDVFRQVGVRSTTRHADDEGQGTEVLPRDDEPVLARCLIAMGVHQGRKTDIQGLPPVATSGIRPLQMSFALAYARHRATSHGSKPTLSLNEKRPERYREALADVFGDVTGESVTAGERGVILSGDAARALGLSN